MECPLHPAYKGSLNQGDRILGDATTSTSDSDFLNGAIVIRKAYFEVEVFGT